MVTKKNEVTPQVEETSLERVISKDQYQSIASFQDALRLAEEAYGELSRSDEFGDGFTKLDDKDKLVNVPFLILDSTIALSKEFTRNGEPGAYVAFRVVTEDAKKYIVVDGSTGICAQIQEWRTKSNRRGGFVAMHGLRKSEYTYTDDKGDTSPAVTYYLDESGS